MAGGKPKRDVVPMQFNLPPDIRGVIARLIAVQAGRGLGYVHRTAAGVVERAIRELDAREAEILYKAAVQETQVQELAGPLTQEFVQTPKGDVHVQGDNDADK
jgi:hypothetical protein